MGPSPGHHPGAAGISDLKIHYVLYSKAMQGIGLQVLLFSLSRAFAEATAYHRHSHLSHRPDRRDLC